MTPERELLKRVAEMDPDYDDPDNGTFCFFCMKQYGYKNVMGTVCFMVEHDADCLYIEIRTFCGLPKERE